SQFDTGLGRQRAMQYHVGAVIFDSCNVEIEGFRGLRIGGLVKIVDEQCRLWPERDEEIALCASWNCDIEQPVTDAQLLIDHLRRKQIYFRRADETRHIDIVGIFIEHHWWGH